MRTLAVDPGTKRIGLAVSDPTGTIAQGLETIAADPPDTLPRRLAAIAGAHGASRVVVGLPRRMDGTYGPEAKAARELAGALRHETGLPVELVDERLTTVTAERALIEGGVRRAARRKAVDRVAATVLLQGHLNRLHAGQAARSSSGSPAPRGGPDR